MMKNLSKNVLLDILFVAILLLLSLFLISFYFHAETINTGYPDWIVHAFRIKSIQESGLLSWTHVWSNGISLWRSYQFVPHYLTLIVISLFHVSITRGMVLMTIGAFIFLHISMYVSLRLLKFSPITAFICAILSFDIAQYWGGVSDYSLLFGFTFFPWIIYAWVTYYTGKIQYIFPYIAGIVFYIHPMLGFSTAALWILTIIFFSKTFFSFSTFLQMVIFLSSSSIFWFPLVHKTSYEYTSPVFANKYFLNLVLAGYKYYGLSLFLLFCLGISSAMMFMLKKSQFQWSKALYIFACLYFFLIVIGLSIDLPKAIDQLQFSRGATLIGIAIIFVFAPVLEKLQNIRSRALKGVLLFFVCLIITEGIWFTSIYSPLPGKNFTEPISSFEKLNPQRSLTDSHVWTSDIGLTSYYASSAYHFPYSYMGHLESNQLSPRLSPLILYQANLNVIPYANLLRLNDYFKLAGVRYIFFDESSPFVTSIQQSDKQIYTDQGIIKNGDSMYHLFTVPWDVKNAAVINPIDKNQMKAFPFTLELTEVNDQIALDEYVKKFVRVLYKPENISLPISYPTQDSLMIPVPKNRSSDMIYVNESFDSGWKGYFQGKQVSLKPVGPNFTLANLHNTTDTGVLVLQHFWPRSFYISVFLIFLIPMEIVLIRSMQTVFFTV